MRRTLSLGLIAVLACAACTKPEPQPVASVPQPEQPTVSAEESNQTTESVQLSPGVDQAAPSAGDPLPTHMNCELDVATARQIASYERELASLLLSYTDKYPGVVSLKETIKRLREGALAQCLAQERTCKLDEPLDSEIRLTIARRDELLKQLQPFNDAHDSANPVYQGLRMRLSEAEVELATLKAKAAAWCVKQTQKDSPGQI